MRHVLDYPPIPVGKAEDWYKTDSKGNYVKDIKGRPYQDDEKWVAARKTANGHMPDGMCIGGSSAAIVAGIFPGHEDGCREYAFKSKLELYNSMRGIDKSCDKSDPSEMFRIGHQYEEAVAEEATQYLQDKFFGPKGLHVIYVNDTRMFQCGVKDSDGNLRFPHAIADLDRILVAYDSKDNVVGTYILEIKTTRDYGEKWTVTPENELGVPEQYQVQTHHYMGVTNINGSFIACKSYKMDSDIIVRFIPRDVALEERILMNEEAFVLDVLAGKVPSCEDEDPSKRAIAEAAYWGIRSKPFDGEKLSLPEEAIDLVEEYNIANRTVSKLLEEEAALKERKDAALSYRTSIENKFAKYFRGTDKACGSILLPDGIYATVWYDRRYKKAGRGFAYSYDLDRMKDENPGLYERVTVSEKVTKLLPKTKIKGNDKTDIEAFASLVPYTDEYGNPIMDCRVTFFDPAEKKTS